MIPTMGCFRPIKYLKIYVKELKFRDKVRSQSPGGPSPLDVDILTAKAEKRREELNVLRFSETCNQCIWNDSPSSQACTLSESLLPPL